MFDHGALGGGKSRFSKNDVVGNIHHIVHCIHPELILFGRGIIYNRFVKKSIVEADYSILFLLKV